MSIKKIEINQLNWLSLNFPTNQIWIHVWLDENRYMYITYVLTFWHIKKKILLCLPTKVVHKFLKKKNLFKYFFWDGTNYSYSCFEDRNFVIMRIARKKKSILVRIILNYNIWSKKRIFDKKCVLHVCTYK